MKLFKGSMLVLLSVLALSCDNESDDKATIDDLSANAKKYLSMKLGGRSADAMSNSAMPGNPVNESFQRLFNNASFVNGRIAGDTTETEPSDTTIYPEPWVSCAQITQVSNNDGSTTITYDYGDGCEEGYDAYKYWMHGKYSYTYKYNFQQNGSVFKDSYYYNSASDNYGGTYYWDGDTTDWSSNGTSSYTGESQYDTANQTYSGNYTSSYDNIYQYKDQSYTYKGSGKFSYTEKQGIVEQNDYQYTTGSDYYKTTVIEPLVSKYDCYMNYYVDGLANYCYYPSYVSGREFIRYKQGDEEGSFEVDYGNGECDNVITVIENGKRVDIDLKTQPVYAW